MTAAQQGLHTSPSQATNTSDEVDEISEASSDKSPNERNNASSNRNFDETVEHDFKGSTLHTAIHRQEIMKHGREGRSVDFAMRFRAEKP